MRLEITQKGKFSCELRAFNTMLCCDPKRVVLCGDIGFYFHVKIIGYDHADVESYLAAAQNLHQFHCSSFQRKSCSIRQYFGANLFNTNLSACAHKPEF